MAEKVDLTEVVTLGKGAIVSMWEIAALVVTSREFLYHLPCERSGRYIGYLFRWNRD